MRIRKPSLPKPPASIEPSELQAAKAIAAAINQGLPGGEFARVMNMMRPEHVRIAAGMTSQQLQDWFTANEAAHFVLNKVPAFPSFCDAFLAVARELHPNAPLFVPGATAQ